MKVLFDYVLVIPDSAEEEKTSSGIYLGKQKTEPRTGTVYKSGEGSFKHGKWIHNEVKENDHVYFSNVFETVNINGSSYYLMRQDNIICVL